MEIPLSKPALPNKSSPLGFINGVEDDQLQISSSLRVAQLLNPAIGSNRPSGGYAVFNRPLQVNEVIYLGVVGLSQSGRAGGWKLAISSSLDAPTTGKTSSRELFSITLSDTELTGHGQLIHHLCLVEEIPKKYKLYQGIDGGTRTVVEFPSSPGPHSLWLLVYPPANGHSIKLFDPTESRVRKKGEMFTKWHGSITTSTKAKHSSLLGRMAHGLWRLTLAVLCRLCGLCRLFWPWQKNEVKGQGTVPQEEKISENECSVCLDEPAVTVVYPCGHSCLCLSCSELLKKRAVTKCPCCTTSIKDIIRLYHS